MKAPAVLIVVLALAAGCSAAGKPRRAAAIRAVDADIAFAMLRDAPELAVVDVRELEEFESAAGHLRAARNAPLSKLEQYYPTLAPLRDASFLVYCRGDDACGEEAVARLAAAGFGNAVLLEGGFAGWMRGGYGALSSAPPAKGDATRESLRATHRRELVDGRLVEGGRDGASGLYVAGRFRNDKFRPVGSVEGVGEFCRGWEKRSGERGRPGWLELGKGLFVGEDARRLPARPYVRGCLGADGRFRPLSRDVTP